MLWERKALSRPLMITEILCQLELRDWLSYRGQQNTLATCNYHVVMGVFFEFFFPYPCLCNTGSLPREIRSDTLTQFPAVKGSFTTVKVSRVATPLICYYSHCLMQKWIMLCFLFPSIWIPYLLCKVLTKYYVIKGLCLSEE